MAIIIQFIFIFSLSFAGIENNPWFETLDSIENQFEEIYCFKDLKREYFGWKSEIEMSRIGKKLKRSGHTNSKQQNRNILNSFYESTRDIHVAARFNTESPFSSSKLPMTMRSSGDGHYYITSIDRNDLPREINTPEVGDEILEIDSKSIQEWVNEYLPTRYAQKETQQALAERYALNHYDLLGKSMPSGNAVIKIRRKKIKPHIIKLNLNWKTSPKKTQILLGLNKGMFMADDRQETNDTFENYGKMGTKKSFFPPLGKIIWESAEEDPFYAYIFELKDGKRVGLVRIPTYYPKNMVTVSIPAFYDLIEHFVKSEISALVYDQTNNSGGSLLYSYDLFRAFIDKPIKPTLNVEWIANETHFEVSRKWKDLLEIATKAKTDDESFKKFQNEIFNDKIVDHEFLDDFISQASFVIDYVSSPNHKRLTPIFPFEGIKLIKPGPRKSYTGPILMLVNELSISSADLTPALYQDLGRATIFGSKTAGAGAYQNAFMAPEGNPFGLFYSSISFGKFTRSSGIPIENHGITPDISYHISARDIQNEMVDYRKAILRALEKMTAK